MPESTPAAGRDDRTTLVCVDLQPVFLATITEGQEIHWRCSFALETARGLGLPIVFTEQVPDKLGGTAPDLLELAGKSSVFAKNTFSALADEKISAHLSAGGARHLLLAGIETSVCVFQTARDAQRAGHRVTVLSDCIGARRGADAAVVLSQLRHRGVEVLPAETVFYSLLQGARHPFFRPFTALVKKYG